MQVTSGSVGQGLGASPGRKSWCMPKLCPISCATTITSVNPIQVAEVAELTHRAGEGVVDVVLDDAGPVHRVGVAGGPDEGQPDLAIGLVLETQVDKGSGV